MPTSLFFRESPSDLSGQRDTARETLAQGDRRPTPRAAGPPRSGSSWPGIELAAGNWAAAEELARAEAIRLLAGDRKDQLAEVYHAFARKLLEPGDPLVQPDPNAAYELLAQARELAESPALARPAPFLHGPRQPGGREPRRAIENFQQYLKEYPRRRRPVRGPAPAGRSPAQGPTSSCRPGSPGPTWPATSNARKPAERSKERRGDPGRRALRDRHRPTESPIRPTTPA